MPGAWGACGGWGGDGGDGGCTMYRLPSTGWPSMRPFPRSWTPTEGMPGGCRDGAAAPGWGMANCGGDGCIGTIVAVFWAWSSTMACCARGSVMTDVAPVSMRIFPSLERIMREADCCPAPPCAYCVVVWHSAHAGGCGGDGGIGDTAPKAYHARAGAAQGLTTPGKPAAAAWAGRPCTRTPWRIPAC